jgi:hypothetical protein
VLRDRQTPVVKTIAGCRRAGALALKEAAQAIQFVKGRFFDRIRAFADSLNPPAHRADDNEADREPLVQQSMRTALWNGSEFGPVRGGGEGSDSRTARCVMADGACGAGGNKVEYKEN